MRRVSQVPGDLRSNLHHIYYFLVSLNASFSGYLRSTHSTFITASFLAVRTEPHTFVSRSLFHQTGPACIHVTVLLCSFSVTVIF